MKFFEYDYVATGSYVILKYPVKQRLECLETATRVRENSELIPCKQRLACVETSAHVRENSDIHEKIKQLYYGAINDRAAYKT